MRALIFAIVLASATLSACADVVIGNGKVESERRTLPAFRSISVGGSGTLKVHRGAQKLVLTCDSNILPYVTTEVQGSELKIGFKPLTSIIRMTKLEYEITMPDLEGIDLSGSGEGYVDAFEGDSFSARLSGSGALKADLDYKDADFRVSGSGGFDVKGDFDRMSLVISGSGEAYLKGSAEKADITISGSGNIGARDFATKAASVGISGSGSVEIRASDSLDLRLSGSGSLRYWGDARVANQRVSGSGRVVRAGN